MQGTMSCRPMSLYLPVCANNRVTYYCCVSRKEDFGDVYRDVFVRMWMGRMGWGGVVWDCVGDVVQVGRMVIKDRRKKCGWLGSF